MTFKQTQEIKKTWGDVKFKNLLPVNEHLNFSVVHSFVAPVAILEREKEKGSRESGDFTGNVISSLFFLIFNKDFHLTNLPQTNNVIFFTAHVNKTRGSTGIKTTAD